MAVAYRLLHPDEEDAAVELWMRVLDTDEYEARQTFRDFRDAPERFEQTHVAVADNGQLLATICYWLRDVRDSAGAAVRIGHDLIFVPSVTVIIFDAYEQVLLARHRDGGSWVAPGGSVDPLECPADAAVREMWEETGLWVTPVRIVGSMAGQHFAGSTRTATRSPTR